jgi:hypothetical protein
LVEILSFFQNSGTELTLEFLLVILIWYKMKQSTTERESFLRVLEEKEANMTELVSKWTHHLSELVILLKGVSKRVDKIEGKLDSHLYDCTRNNFK